MPDEEILRFHLGPKFLKIVTEHNMSHKGAEKLWEFFMSSQELLQRATEANPAKVSYRTLRRDAEAQLPPVKMDLIRVGSAPGSQDVVEVGVSSIKQDPTLLKRMETAYVSVSVLFVILITIPPQK